MLRTTNMCCFTLSSMREGRYGPCTCSSFEETVGRSRSKAAAADSATVPVPCTDASVANVLCHFTAAESHVQMQQALSDLTGPQAAGAAASLGVCGMCAGIEVASD